MNGKKKFKKVAVLMGGPSSERAVSLRSGAAVATQAGLGAGVPAAGWAAGAGPSSRMNSCDWAIAAEGRARAASSSSVRARWGIGGRISGRWGAGGVPHRGRIPEGPGG